MKLIPLSRGMFAKVDDEWYDYLNQWKWSVKESGKNWYAVRCAFANGKNTMIKMHNVIMWNESELIVDHCDTDGLNNQTYNLRMATKSQNGMNCSRRKNCTSTYKGVYWYRDRHKWAAQIMKDYKRIHIGYFMEEVEAAMQYDLRAKELFGDFARLNFPNLHNKLAI